jgi:hypothetical protein
VLGGAGTTPAIPPGVTHRNVEALIGRLATDPAMRRRFVEDPARVLRELTEEGYELTPVEIDALASTNGDAIHSFADSLDRRIRRALVNAESTTSKE